ncbi:hypothetical protein H8959_016558 [Pygathrix nigripes]
MYSNENGGHLCTLTAHLGHLFTSTPKLFVEGTFFHPKPGLSYTNSLLVVPLSKIMDPSYKDIQGRNNEEEIGQRELTSDPSFLTTVLCALGGFSLLLGLASREQRLQRWTRPLSGLVWVALLALGHAFLFTGGVVSAWDQVSYFLFVIFTVYAMLPLGMRDAAVAGLASSLSHLLVLGLYLGPQPDSRPALLPQLAANAVLFLCGNVAGVYHKALMERALRATFREALSSLHSRRRLDTEKKHQEHLLLSILPAYLAREMKAEIMARLQAGQGSRPESTNNFHSLYVKRHQGVSVLYADIVGFTRLASECSPKELVLMLNELFGKFDQIAKVREGFPPHPGTLKFPVLGSPFQGKLPPYKIPGPLQCMQAPRYPNGKRKPSQTFPVMKLLTTHLKPAEIPQYLHRCPKYNAPYKLRAPTYVSLDTMTKSIETF